MNGMMKMMVLGLISSVGAGFSGCDDLGNGSAAPVAVNLGQLSAVMAAGPTRVDITLAPGGAVSELHASAELGHDEHLQGVVIGADPAGRVLELADIGSVAWTAGARFRVPGESHASEAAWLAALEQARAAGSAVVVRASRPEPVGGPALEAFVATDLRLEDGDDQRAKLELLLDAAAIDAGAALLTVFGRAHDLSGARLFDDNGGHGTELGDDNGGSGSEPSDDNGGNGSEPGDDNGDDGAELGDDNGGSGSEPGDDD